MYLLVSFIVCEGERTEPNYFKGFNKKTVYSDIREVTIEGKGQGDSQSYQRNHSYS